LEGSRGSLLSIDSRGIRSHLFALFSVQRESAAIS
jgi:hypothetical protein